MMIRNKNILGIELILFFAFLSISCSPDENILEYRNSSIAGVVDSTIYFKTFGGKKHYFSVEGKWYAVHGRYYGNFFHYLDKSDSVFKKSGRWDIYVYKKTNGKYKEKYFRGAQDDWE